MLTTPYLVQRMVTTVFGQPCPIIPYRAMKPALEGYFRYEFMGWAEFEWGQQASSFHEMKSEGLCDSRFEVIRLDFNSAGNACEITDLESESIGPVYTIYFLGPRERLNAARHLIKGSMTNQEREPNEFKLKDKTNLKGAYLSGTKTSVWWCLDRELGFLLFKNREDVDTFRKAALTDDVPEPKTDSR